MTGEPIANAWPVPRRRDVQEAREEARGVSKEVVLTRTTLLLFIILLVVIVVVVVVVVVCDGSHSTKYCCSTNKEKVKRVLKQSEAGAGCSVSARARAKELVSSRR